MGRFDGVMILTDMDGTLLNSQRQLSRGNQEAARYFMEQGGLFSVATGRAKRAMEYFMPELAINAPAVLFNGSVVYDFEKNAPGRKDGLGLCPGYDGAFPLPGL